MTADKIWCLRRRENAAFIRSHSSLDPLVARVLWARHIDQDDKLETFLQARGQRQDLADPQTLSGMDKAVERLSRAVEGRENIVIYGDFDADGISATALLYKTLQALEARVETYIPDRFSEAYGLNIPALERLKADGADLVVTVDCGIRSSAEVEAARQQGLDVIITDHHSVPNDLPPALAVVDPKQPGCSYPFKDLSGVGIAYQLARALYRALQQPEPSQELLALVALGTVSDIVPLSGENRSLVQSGLETMRRTPYPGLQALMAAAGVAPAQLDSSAIAFRLGPRINAAGRLHTGQLALDLLLTDDPSAASQLAQQLSEVNAERQSQLVQQVALAQELIQGSSHPYILFAEHPAFHEGLVGLVASKLCEEYYRPAFVMKSGKETTRGSARSIEGIHVTEALSSCQDLMLRYGGHARAAGFTLSTPNVALLRQRLEEYVSSLASEDIFTERLLVDAIVPLEMISPQSPAALSALEPFGEANPEPALATLGLVVTRLRQVGADNHHLRLDLSDGQRVLPAIAFRQGDKANALANGQLIDIVYHPSIETWQGQPTLQLIVQDLRPHHHNK